MMSTLNEKSIHDNLIDSSNESNTSSDSDSTKNSTEQKKQKLKHQLRSKGFSKMAKNHRFRNSVWKSPVYNKNDTENFGDKINISPKSDVKINNDSDSSILEALIELDSKSSQHIKLPIIHNYSGASHNKMFAIEELQRKNSPELKKNGRMRLVKPNDLINKEDEFRRKTSKYSNNEIYQTEIEARGKHLEIDIGYQLQNKCYDGSSSSTDINVKTLCNILPQQGLKSTAFIKSDETKKIRSNKSDVKKNSNVVSRKFGRLTHTIGCCEYELTNKECSYVKDRKQDYLQDVYCDNTLTIKNKSVRSDISQDIYERPELGHKIDCDEHKSSNKERSVVREKEHNHQVEYCDINKIRENKSEDSGMEEHEIILSRIFGRLERVLGWSNNKENNKTFPNVEPKQNKDETIWYKDNLGESSNTEEISQNHLKDADCNFAKTSKKPHSGIPQDTIGRLKMGHKRGYDEHELTNKERSKVKETKPNNFQDRYCNVSKRHENKNEFHGMEEHEIILSRMFGRLERVLGWSNNEENNKTGPNVEPKQNKDEKRWYKVNLSESSNTGEISQNHLKYADYNFAKTSKKPHSGIPQDTIERPKMDHKLGCDEHEWTNKEMSNVKETKPNNFQDRYCNVSKTRENKNEFHGMEEHEIIISRMFGRLERVLGWDNNGKNNSIPDLQQRKCEDEDGQCKDNLTEESDIEGIKQKYLQNTDYNFIKTSKYNNVHSVCSRNILGKQTQEFGWNEDELTYKECSDVRAKEKHYLQNAYCNLTETRKNKNEENVMEEHEIILSRIFGRLEQVLGWNDKKNNKTLPDVEQKMCKNHTDKTNCLKQHYRKNTSNASDNYIEPVHDNKLSKVSSSSTSLLKTRISDSSNGEFKYNQNKVDLPNMFENKCLKNETLKNTSTSSIKPCKNQAFSGIPSGMNYIQEHDNINSSLNEVEVHKNYNIETIEKSKGKLTRKHKTQKNDSVLVSSNICNTHEEELNPASTSKSPFSNKKRGIGVTASKNSPRNNKKENIKDYSTANKSSMSPSKLSVKKQLYLSENKIQLKSSEKCNVDKLMLVRVERLEENDTLNGIKRKELNCQQLMNESSPSKKSATKTVRDPSELRKSVKYLPKSCLEVLSEEISFNISCEGTPNKEIKDSPSKYCLRKNDNSSKLTNEQTPSKVKNTSSEVVSSRKRSRKMSTSSEDSCQTSGNVIQESDCSLKKQPKNQGDWCETETEDKNKNKSVNLKMGISATIIQETEMLYSDIQKFSSPVQQKNITVRTPVSKKNTDRMYLTPTMAKREHGTHAQQDELDTTRKQLHISTIPKSLPCRDAEFSQIKSFLHRKIVHTEGGCMYISGVPGTGKTATVLAVIRSLQEEADKEILPDFDFVEINGLRLTEPKQAYVRIYQALTDQKLTSDQAQQLLDKRFSGTCRKSTIILVDELDYLCNRRQDVVYNIMDWPTKINSGLVVVTISNTMDLPERTLKGKVTSRMGLTRIMFHPYSFHQLREIVENRLSGSSTFHPDAVQLVARKVAAVSGDARRALDICRRTTESVDSGEQVTVAHVERALTQIFSGPRVVVIQSLSQLGQLVLRSLRDVNERTGVDEATANQVYRHLESICTLEGCLLPAVGTVLQVCVSLVSLGLIVAEKGRMDITRKMSLNVSSDDIHYALNNKET